MTIDPSLAGRRFATSAPYQIGREKIREFAAAIGDQNAAYQDAAAARALGHESVLAPPTFATVLTLDSWRDVFAELGIDLADVLHVDQRFVFSRALRAGDVVRTETALEDVRERMGASWLTVRADVVTEAAEHLCTAVSTIMVRNHGGD